MKKRPTRAFERVGLLSDSHGRAALTGEAVRLLIDEGVDVLLHLGDIGSPEVIDALVHRAKSGSAPDPPVHVVFGNVDHDASRLAKRARQLGVLVDDPVGRLRVAGRTLVFLHGHSLAGFDQAISDGVDYLCHGHTHTTRDERIYRTRVINPGALHRTRRYTVAILDVPRDRLHLLTVPRSAR